MMIVFADINTGTSLNTLIGPNWQIFLQPASFDPESIETLTLDSLLASHMGIIAASSSLLANKTIKFVHAAKSMPNPSVGQEENMPRDNGEYLYRVGIVGISAIDLTDLEKMRLLLNNNTQFSKTFTPLDPKAVFTVTLNTEVRVDKIAYTCNIPYTVECFTTEWVPFVAGTVCSAIRITLSVQTTSTVTSGNIVVYTKDASAIDITEDIASYAVLISNAAQTPPLPAMVVDVSNWDTEGTLMLNDNIVGAAQCPTLLNLALKPVLLEA